MSIDTPNPDYVEWEKRAIVALFELTAPAHRFTVIKRVCETASMAVRVVAAMQDDIVGKRLEILSRTNTTFLNKPEIVQTEFLSNEEALNQCETSPKPVSYTIPPINQEDQMTLLPKGIPEVCLSDIERRIRSHDCRLILPARDMNISANEVALLAESVDDFLFWRLKSDSFKFEYIEAIEVQDKLLLIALILFKYLGEEVINLVIAITLYIHTKTNPEVLSSLWDIRHDIMIVDLEKKRVLCQKFGLDVSNEFEEQELKELLQWVLGRSLYAKIANGTQEDNDISKTPLEVLEIAKGIFINSSNFREKILVALKTKTHSVDKILASTLLRQGWVTLADMSRVVTDYEWFQMIRGQIEDLESNPTKLASLLDTESRRARFQEQKADVEDFFNQKSQPEFEEVELLAKAIGCDEYVLQIQKLTRSHERLGLVALQNEICAKIVRYVSRYKMGREKNAKDTWEAGFPVNVIKNKDATCFSGPMLIAALMIKAGIPQENIFYCNVNEGMDGMLGGHGSLIVKFINGDLHFYDHGFSICGNTVNPMWFGDTASDVIELVCGRNQQAVKVEISPDNVKNFGLNRKMQIMPIINGFGSGHMLHVGLDFLAKNEYESANYAFELGLSFSPSDPDLLHGIARVHYLRREYLDAIRYSKLALEYFGSHAWSRMTLAESYIKKKDIDKAREVLEGLANEQRYIYEGEILKENAKALLASLKKSD